MIRHPAVRFAVIPILLWSLALGLVRISVMPPERCGVPDPVEARAAAQRAVGWVETNQFADGSYVYEYDANTDRLSEDYNVVRHAGVTLSLYQEAGQLHDQAAFRSAERGLAWLLNNMVEVDNWASPSDGETAKVGSAALMEIALAERRLLTGDHQYDDLMRKLGNFLVRQQRDNGGFFIKWWVQRAEMDRTGRSAYYPGEALWALALLHEAFPGEGWDVAAWKAADFVTLLRDDVEDIQYPPLNDHWAAYGMAEMAEWGLADYHIAYARRLAGRFSLFIRFEAQKTDAGLNLKLRGDSRRSAALGTWVEGMAALWRLAKADQRMADIADPILAQAACGADLLIERQRPADAPPLEAGGWFIHGVTRMDDQQHSTSGLLYTADALEGNVQREPDPAVSK